MFLVRFLRGLNYRAVCALFWVLLLLIIIILLLCLLLCYYYYIIIPILARWGCENSYRGYSFFSCPLSQQRLPGRFGTSSLDLVLPAKSPEPSAA